MANPAYQRIVNENRPVLFVGEGTFSFSLAVAALRSVGDDTIKATEITMNKVDDFSELALNISEDNNLRKDILLHFRKKEINETLLSNLQRALESNLNLDLNAEEKLDIVNRYLRLQGFSPEYGVDARKLNAFSQSPCKENIFFQCPWKYPGDTAKLLCNFLKSAAAIQDQGHYIFIGYDTGSYVGTYDLVGFKNLAAELGYDCLPDDVFLQQEAKRFGYYHFSHSGFDLNDSLILSTLCLRKAET